MSGRRPSGRGCGTRCAAGGRCAWASTRTRACSTTGDCRTRSPGWRRFALTCVEAFAGVAAAVKPQSAFFEVHGSAGVAVLERTLAALREAGTLSILDAKRGDIGSTMAAYAEAYLTDGAPLRADAVTVSPYLGYGSLRPALDPAAGTGRGVFVLALTSNPEGPTVQHAGGAGASVAGGVVAGAPGRQRGCGQAWRAGQRGPGCRRDRRATPCSELGLDLAAANAPLLAPGVGAQGGTAEDLRRVFGAALPNVLASTSREVLSAGPSVSALRERATRAAASLRELIG